MKCPTGPQAPIDTKGSVDAVQSFLPVDIHILQCIDDVEPSHPAEDHDESSHRAADVSGSRVGRRWRPSGLMAKAPSQRWHAHVIASAAGRHSHAMTGSPGHGHQLSISTRRAGRRPGRRESRSGPRPARCPGGLAGGQGSSGRPGIPGVDVMIQPAVGEHGGRPRADHGHDDQKNGDGQLPASDRRKRW